MIFTFFGFILKLVVKLRSLVLLTPDVVEKNGHFTGFTTQFDLSKLGARRRV
ncbi:hypothetical protein L963_1526 [Leuconostoc mesenteroides subsp. cremoris T26]|nr:hypothetical protein L963_1526 [Leuconostoc mesenteroides subsp. cremoris T26]